MDRCADDRWSSRGNGMNTIAIPIWQAETARPEHRGKLIVAQLVTNIFGIVITNASVPNRPHNIIINKQLTVSSG